MRRLLYLLSSLVLLAACGSGGGGVSSSGYNPALFPGETAEIRALVNQYADENEIPRELVHRVIQRESDY